MIRLLSLISFILLLVSCSEKIAEEESINLEIDFNASSTVIFHYENAQDSVFLETSFYNLFPSDYIETKTLLINNIGIKELTFKIQHPQKIKLYFGDVVATCFLIPNDTLEIHIDLDTNQSIKKNMKFSGKYAAINNFYKNKASHYSKTGALFPNLIGLSTQKTISEYSSFIDSLTQIELNYINSYKHKYLLPMWFIDYELSEIKCSTAGSKFSIVKYKRRFSKQEINLPENYYNEIDTFMKGYAPSIISSSYYIYIENKFVHDITSAYNAEDSLNWGEVYRQRNVDMSLKYLDEEAADIYLSKYLERMISIGQLNDTTYQLYYNAIKSKELKKYLSNKKETGEFLKPGERAPSFMLPDIDGKEVQLKDLKGSIVYINFWFAGCAPCRAEFPDENKLVEKYKGKKVKIINICTITSKENWKKVSEKFNLQMVNLYADEILTPFIEKNYGITGYPHHVLIDAEGKIIKNKCARANKIEEEINNQLEKLN